jgi:hypothetical protein
MDDIKSVKNHLKGLKRNDWDKLFALIPLIESCEKFVISGGFVEDIQNPDSFIITPIIETEVVLDFEKIMYELELVIPFGWSNWTIGREIVSKGVFENLDTITLLKILTAIIRNNRFCDGALADRFEDKTIEKILKQLKRNIDLDNGN